MNITLLRYVLAVERYSSFSLAAQHLFISQPALSQQVSSLEEELGYKIFKRNGRGAVLTEEGVNFCEQSRIMLDRWEEFCRNVDYEGSGRRQLRIGMGPRAYSNGLFEKILDFLEQNPELEASFINDASSDFMVALSEGRLDLSLDIIPSRDSRFSKFSVSVTELIKEPQCVLMSRNDSRSSLPSISFSMLQGTTVMTSLENTAEEKQFSLQLKEYGIVPSKIYRSDSIDTIMMLVKSGRGVITGPRSFADYYGVAAVPLDPPAEGSLSFVCLEKNSRRPDIALLRSYLESICSVKAEEAGK